MSIKIEGKKVIYKDMKCVEITKIQALTENKLPIGYIQSEKYWAVQTAEGSLKCSNGNGKYSFLFLGTTHPMEHFIEIIENCREAGKRLERINKKLRLKNKNWKGNITIEI